MSRSHGLTTCRPARATPSGPILCTNIAAYKVGTMTDPHVADTLTDTFTIIFIPAPRGEGKGNLLAG
jgi:hypothetical protein